MVQRNTGDIVNMGSISGFNVPDMDPNNASKAGIHMLTDVIRAELAETGIRVTEDHAGPNTDRNYSNALSRRSR